MGVFNAGTFEDGRNEIRLGEGTNECSLAIDDRVRDTADPELVREVGELVRFNADGAHVGRRQRHAIGQAHGPGTVGSGRRRKDHHLSGLG